MRGSATAGAAALSVGLLLAADATATFPGKNRNVLFLSDRAHGVTQVWVADPSGRSRRNLKFGASTASWSPEGRLIAFAAQGEIYTLKPNGRELRQLTRNRVQDTSPTWSPNGKRILFLSRGGFFVMSATGHNRRRLRRSAMCPGPPDWSARGGRIAFASQCPQQGTLLYVMGSKGGHLRQIGPGNNPEFSPDGSQLVIDSGYPSFPRRIEIIALDGSNRRVVALGENPAWSPDGQRIVFAREETSLCAPYQRVSRLLSVAIDGVDEQEVTPRSSTGSCDFEDRAPEWQPSR